MKTNAIINLRNIIVIVLLTTIFTSNVSISSADPIPPIPNTFSGAVKFVNSSGQFYAPAGTLIEALIDNVTKGDALVAAAGNYSIDVIGTDEDNGKDIIFKVNNLTVEQKGVFNTSMPRPQTLDLLVNLPSSISVIINNGDNYTNSTAVVLSLSGDNIEQMSFSNDNVSWSPWENFTATKSWNLSVGDGLKTVYLKAKYGMVEVAPVSDTIILDTIPPEVNISEPVQNATLKYFENIVEGTLKDDNIQYAKLIVRNETTLWLREYSLNLTSTGYIYKFTERVEFAGDQSNTIELFALDKAGNSNATSVVVLVRNNTYVNETNVTSGYPTIIDAKNESDTEIEFIPNVTRDVTFTVTANTNKTLVDDVTNSSSKFGEIALGKIVEVNVTGLNATNKSEVQSVTIKLFYTKEDLDAKGLDEDKLFVYWYNTSSGDWTKLLKGNPEWVLDNGQVKINDSNPGYIWVKVEHLSTFALVGSSYSAPTPTPTAPAPPSSGGGGSSGGGSSGGGGGGTSGENYTNIEVKEKYDLYIFKNKVTSYAFTNRSNPILFINITGNTNAGEITAMVEVLKGTSTLVNSSAPGVVYKNVNIWVGTSGFASPRNIKEATITFIVENSWLDENNLARNDIRLARWDGNSWKKLETSEKTRNSTYTYFKAKTNSFSPFAIIGFKGGVMPPVTPGITTTVTNTPAATQLPSEKAPPMNLAIIVGVIFLIAIGMVVYLKRKNSIKK